MTNGSVKGIVTFLNVAVISGGLHAAEVKSDFVSSVPLAQASSMSEYNSVRPKSLVSGGGDVEFAVSAKYEVSEGLYYDPGKMTLETDFNENGKIVWSRDGVTYQMEKDSSVHDVSDYYSYLEVSSGDFMGNLEKLFNGERVEDFDVPGSTLEELAKSIGKDYDLPNFEKGKGYLKYNIGLAATPSTVPKIKFFGDYDIDVRDGFFAPAVLRGVSYAAEIKSDFVSSVPLAQVPLANEYNSVRPKGLVPEGSEAYSTASARREVSEGLSLDLEGKILTANLTENGRLIWNGDGVTYQLREGSLVRDIGDYFDNLEMNSDSFMEEAKKILEGGIIKDANISGWTLGELVGFFNKIDEFSRFEKGKDYWKYDIGLDIMTRVRASTVSENWLSGEYDVFVRNGSFASAVGFANAYFHAGASWNQDDVSGQAKVDFGHSSGFEIAKGRFAEVRASLGNFDFGIGGIYKEGISETKSFRYFEDVNADLGGLSSNTKKLEETIETAVKSREDIVYFPRGIRGNGFSLSGNLGFIKSSREGSKKTTVVGEGSGRGPDGLKEYDLGSETLEKINESSSGLIRSVLAKASILNTEDVKFDVYAYLNTYSDKGGSGFIFQSDFVNADFGGERDYFVSVKLAGDFVSVKLPREGGDFDNDFERRRLEKISFLEKYVTRGDVRWENKNGIYLFASSDEDKEETGFFAGLDWFRLKGSSIVEGAYNGVSLGVDVGGFNVAFTDIKSADERNEEKSVDMGFNFKDYPFFKDYLVLAGAKYTSGDGSIFFNIRRSF